jgi:asparagine synthase (glutamine-hydrolysing)
MCGICGFAPAEPGRQPDEALLRRMTETLRHRGPDGQGFHQAPGIGLGVQRLAIVDLAGGDQPIASPDGSLTLVCNGEIYNYVELRQELRARGHRFRTGSDVEVILHLYEEHGPGCLAHLRGMFGLALWDARRRRLLLARDRLGIKPLHYALTPAGCWFGSEYKAILASGQVAVELDPLALGELLRFSFILPPRTLCTAVRQLPPGHYLLWEAGEAKLARYWQVSFPRRQDEEREVPARVWAARLLEKLEEAVRLHLRADVPSGAWLSSGLDSSGIAALMSRFAPRPIQTFSIGFDDPSVDELRGRRTLADYPEYGLAGHRVTCTQTDLERYPRALWHGEDPHAALLEVPIAMLAQATGQQLKVVLTGEGSDELFEGYPWYKLDRLLRPLSRLPGGLRRQALRLPPLPAYFRWSGRWAARALAASPCSRLERYADYAGPLDLTPASTLLSAELWERLAGQAERGAAPFEPAEFQHWHPLAQIQYYDLTLRLPGMIVHHLDRLTMAESVEARVPFLDHEFVELAARVPASLKLRGWREKYILRQALRGQLPAEIASRPKYGLRAPQQTWLSGPLPAFAREALSPAALRQAGYFEPACTLRLLAEHQTGAADHGGLLSAILGVQLWHALFVQRTPFSALETTS